MNEKCEKYFILIEKLVEREELDEQLAARTESHIFDCAECQSKHELLRQEKEVLAHYLFEFEPPPDSWMNLQTRLIENEQLTRPELVARAESPRRRKRILVFGLSPALAAFAGLLLFFGIGFVLLRKALTETNEKRVAEIKPEVSQRLSTPSDALKSDKSLSKNQSSKSGSDSFFGKKFLAVETVKIKQKTVSYGVEKKPARASVLDDGARAATLQRRNLETEIAEQIEKIELLLRSFRNARVAENAVAFDVEYEKRQARKLLTANVALRRDAETFGISYAEELLSRVEPYLLEIANLESNPAPDKVLDIKGRVSSQNIISGLQVYSSVAMRR